jgi:hypothetical protein
MALISIAAAGSQILEAEGSDRSSWDAAIARLIATVAARTLAVVDAHLAGAGAGAVYVLALVCTPADAPDMATPFYDPNVAPLVGRSCLAGSWKELQAQIAAVQAELVAAGYLSIAKVEHAGAGAGALFAAVLLASKEPVQSGPTPPPSGPLTTTTQLVGQFAALFGDNRITPLGTFDHTSATGNVRCSVILQCTADGAIVPGTGVLVLNVSGGGFAGVTSYPDQTTSPDPSKGAVQVIYEDSRAASALPLVITGQHEAPGLSATILLQTSLMTVTIQDIVPGP